MSKLASAPSVEQSAFGETAPGRSSSGAATQPLTPGSLWTIPDALYSSSRATKTPLGEVDAASTVAKVARDLIRSISEETKARFYEEHARLVERQFVESLSHEESVRLRYLRWQIDRLQDADAGDDLDRLDVLIGLHEQISAEVTQFANHATSIGSNRGGRAPPRRR